MIAIDFGICGFMVLPNAKVIDGSQLPMAFDLFVIDWAGSQILFDQEIFPGYLPLDGREGIACHHLPIHLTPEVAANIGDGSRSPLHPREQAYGRFMGDS